MRALPIRPSGWVADRVFRRISLACRRILTYIHRLFEARMTSDVTYNEPIFCRPEAFQFFVDQMPILWSTDGLVRAAIAVSMHALDDAVPERA